MSIIIYKVIWILLTSFLRSYVNGKCYFPGELQGVWATQAAPNIRDAPIGYSMVTITPEEISVWGTCVSKKGNEVILVDRLSGGSASCFRCFHVIIASLNVVSITSPSLRTCFSSAKNAFASCPKNVRGTTNVILYKVRSTWGESGLQENECPFNGFYSFTFEKGYRDHNNIIGRSCVQPTSEMSNCPFGFSLSLQYRDCSFEEPRTANWYCLGSWEGLDGQLYTTVLDTYSTEGDGQPKYKCGIYREDKENKRTFLSFSRDSTCKNDLTSAEEGYERYVLYRAPNSPLPSTVKQRICRFHRNIRGRWYRMSIGKSFIKYYDEETFNIYHMHCSRALDDSDMYVVYSRTECGRWFYNCVKFKRRAANILEVMFGERKSQDPSYEICDEKYFTVKSKWITLARESTKVIQSCPIKGSYMGELPDSPGYCAHIDSDCSESNLIRYKVDKCDAPNKIYEDEMTFRSNVQLNDSFHSSDIAFPPSTRYNYDYESNTHRSNARTINEHNFIEVDNVPLTFTPSRDSRHRYFGSKSLIGTSLTVGRRKRSWDRIYRARNPKTTTISFMWGKPKTSLYSTTNHPLIYNQTDSMHFTHSPVVRDHTYNQRNIYEDRRYNARGLRNFNTQKPSRNNDLFSAEWSDEETQISVEKNEQNEFERKSFFHSIENKWAKINPDPRVASIIRKSGGGEQSRNSVSPQKWNHFHITSSQVKQAIHGGVPISNVVHHPVNSETVHGIDALRNRINDDYYNEGNPPLGVSSLQLNEQELSPFLTDITRNTVEHDKKINNDLNIIFENATEKSLVEERVYQCIGHWEENGRIYSLTRRKDIHTYECFVGAKSGGLIYLKEAGSSCSRDVDPKRFSIKPVTESKCPNEVPNTELIARKASRWRPSSTLAPIPSTSRSWKPITGRPRSNANQNPSSSKLTTALIVLLIYMCNLL